MNDPKVIEALRRSVAAHWTAIEVYTCQVAHFKAWGYPRLAEAVGADPTEEHKHLDRLLERLEFLEALTDRPEASPQPEYAEDMPEGDESWPRGDLPGIVEFNLNLESFAAQFERDGCQAALDAGDFGTFQVFQENLAGSEEDILTLKATARKLTDQTVANFLSAFNG